MILLHQQEYLLQQRQPTESWKTAYKLPTNADRFVIEYRKWFDKPEVCARIEWAGVGINLKTGKPTQQQIRLAVRKLVADNRYKIRAQDFQTVIRQYNAPALAATRLEQLAATKQPVFRSE